MRPLSIYLHFPFCTSKCAYCDFNSIVAPEDLRRQYLAALHHAISSAGEAAGIGSDGGGEVAIATTVYFGGGTPTLYQPDELAAVLAHLRRSVGMVARPEITVEANPGTVTAPGLSLLHESGFTRLSLGVQSLLDDELRLLGRTHSAAQAVRAFADARAAGFDNVSLDLIAALPGQTVGGWTATLRDAIELRPEHMSCYGLSLGASRLAADVAAGRLPRPDEDTGVRIYELTHEMLTAAGYEHYEVANYALPGHRCRHSLNYWHNGEYLGLGAGAWSYLGGRRLRQEPDPAAWVALVEAGQPTVVETEELDDRARAGEAIMLALRTSDGIALADLQTRYGLDPERYALRISALVESGLAMDLPDRLVLDPVRGFLLQSEIAQIFM